MGLTIITRPSEVMIDTVSDTSLSRNMKHDHSDEAKLNYHAHTITASSASHVNYSVDILQIEDTVEQRFQGVQGHDV